MNPTLIYIIAALMIAAGLGFVVLTLRGNERPVPQGGGQWAAVVLAALLVGFSAFLVVITYRIDRGLMTVDAAGMPRLTEAEMNAPAENFSFRLVDSEEASALEAYRGNVVLLNFWATWCAPCLKELPDLNRLQERYRDEGLVVLTLSDEARADLVAFEEEQIPLQTVAGYLTDPSTLPQPFQRTLAVRPSTYIVDRDGFIREFFLGSRDYPFFEQVVRPYLNAPLARR